MSEVSSMATLTYKQERWSLEELFPAIESPALTAGLEKVEGLATAFESQRSVLQPEMDQSEFTRVLRGYDELILEMQRIEYFAFLLFSEDTQDQKAQSFMAQMQQLAAEMENRTLFFKLWWKALEEPQAERLAAVAGDRRYWLLLLRLPKGLPPSGAHEKGSQPKE